MKPIKIKFFSPPIWSLYMVMNYIIIISVARKDPSWSLVSSDYCAHLIIISFESSQNYCCFYCKSLSTKSKSSPKTTWIAPVDVAIPQMCSLNGNTRGLHYIFCKTRCLQTLEKHCYHFRQLLIFLFTNESTTYAYIYIYTGYNFL